MFKNTCSFVLCILGFFIAVKALKLAPISLKDQRQNEIHVNISFCSSMITPNWRVFSSPLQVVFPAVVSKNPPLFRPAGQVAVVEIKLKTDLDFIAKLALNLDLFKIGLFELQKTAETTLFLLSLDTARFHRKLQQKAAIFDETKAENFTIEREVFGLVVGEDFPFIAKLVAPKVLLSKSGPVADRLVNYCDESYCLTTKMTLSRVKNSSETKTKGLVEGFGRNLIAKQVFGEDFNGLAIQFIASWVKITLGKGRINPKPPKFIFFEKKSKIPFSWRLSPLGEKGYCEKTPKKYEKSSSFANKSPFSSQKTIKIINFSKKTPNPSPSRPWQARNSDLEPFPSKFSRKNKRAPTLFIAKNP